MHNTL